MNTNTKKLSPSILWKYFDLLCHIPRPSKHEAQAAQFIIDFAKKHNLTWKQDKTGNVMVSKPATKGMENCKTIVMQAHLDMVPQKNEGVVHDFTTDPIVPLIDGDWVKAKDTTLGADNGIGVAAAMAVMEAKNLIHGPLEALFTVDEETGMTGALSLEPGFITGDILLNLDSEDDNELTIGCAGGMNTTGTFNYTLEETSKDTMGYKIAVTGLKGGHSGVDIHLNRANSIKLITRFLWEATKKFNVSISGLHGGTLRNAIPREAFATIVVKKEHQDAFTDFYDQFIQTVSSEYHISEPSLKLDVTPVNRPDKALPLPLQKQLLNMLYAIPHGVIKMMEDIPGVVESSNNLASVEMNDDTFSIQNLVRSAQESSKTSTGNMIESIFTLAGAKTVHDGNYQGWQPNINSPVLKLVKEVYNKLFDDLPEVKVIHAGLECGIIGSIYENMDMISFGPTIVHPHSPGEKVNIPSVQKFWELLTMVLKKMALF